MDKENATRSVITVGAGRGFVISGERGRLVITAAHCLPFIPPAFAASDLHERTYGGLLARLGEVPTVSAECLFVDPVADLAVLGSPDDQELPEAAEAHEILIDSMQPLEIAEARQRETAWLLSLKNEWHRCVAMHNGGGIWVTGATGQGINAGMSGSPILNSAGAAIGVVCLGNGEFNATNGGPNPRLMAHLPGWMIQAKGQQDRPDRSQHKPAPIRVLDEEDQSGPNILI